jgi:hypothetical protein
MTFLSKIYKSIQKYMDRNRRATFIPDNVIRVDFRDGRVMTLNEVDAIQLRDDLAIAIIHAQDERLFDIDTSRATNGDMG